MGIAAVEGTSARAGVAAVEGTIADGAGVAVAEGKLVAGCAATAGAAGNCWLAGTVTCGVEQTGAGDDEVDSVS